MVLEMMRTTSKVSKKSLFLVINFLFLNLLCAAENRWTIAAQKFSYSKGQVSNSVTDATAVSIPADILENINKTLVRNVYPDEKLERARYESRKERQSLYLQLTSEYKKRDSLVLQNYSDSKMKKALGEANKKIDAIIETIDRGEGKEKKHSIVSVRSYIDRAIGELLNQALYDLDVQRERNPDNMELFSAKGSHRIVALSVGVILSHFFQIWKFEKFALSLQPNSITNIIITL